MTRVGWLDALRGLAVLLMVADHVVVVFELGEAWRLLTRPALPLFLVTMGALLRPGWRRRHLELIGAAAISWPLAVYLELAAVPVLVVIALCLPYIVEVLARWPLLGGAAALTGWGTIAVGWDGYEPGLVVGLVALGALAQDRLPAWSWRVPPLEALGRRPLLAYVGHLVLLAAAVAIW